MIKVFKNLIILVSILCITCIVFTASCTYAVNFDEGSDNSAISSDSMYDEEVDGEQSENSSVSNSSNTDSNSNSSSNNTNTNSSNTTNTSSTNETLNTATVSSVTDNDSSDGLQLSDILNILLIVIGTLLILLAIAIIIRLKG